MSKLRIGGIASGFDTDQIIRDLMRVERLRVDKSFQQRQVLQWQKSQYRDMTNKVRSFRDTYFDILRPATNMMSANNLKKITATSSHPHLVTVLGNADAFTGTTEFQVSQSATAAQAVAAGVSGAGNGHLNLSDTMVQVSHKLNQAGALAFDDNGNFTVNINNTDIAVNQHDTLHTVLSRINNSNAGVHAAYSSFSDTLTFTAKATGNASLHVIDGGNFFAALGLVAPEGTGGEPVAIGHPGRDAIFKIGGKEGTRSANNFTIDGITYAINQQIDTPTDAIKITVSVDTHAIYSTIEKFINDYNQLIDDVSSKLKEEHFRGFSPLTDEQKEAMKDRDIERWEQKAQSGLLRRDPALENLLRNMRSALFDLVGEDHLTSFGIEPSRNYLDNGKLVLSNGGNDLRTAITENPDRVINLFTRRANLAYSPNLSVEDRAQRYQESGLAHRLSDILQHNIRTGRDNAGRKGIMVERAGAVADTSEFNNFYDNRIKQVNQQIDRINGLLQRKEASLCS